jgi:hypothetical protein
MIFQGESLEDETLLPSGDRKGRPYNTISA